MMLRFYLLLWLGWAVRLSICSVVLACGFSALITLFLYINQGMPSLGTEVNQALFSLFKFWFVISWSFTLLIALFRSLKFVFNKPHANYKLKLLACGSLDVIEEIGYGDLIKVWRKWFMLLIWLVGSVMVFALVITHLFSSYTGLFEWFNIYWLFGFVLLSGYFSFILLSVRCKKVKVVRC